jgi:hypothetical protein
MTTVELNFDVNGLGSYTDFTRINDTCRMLGGDGTSGVTITEGRRTAGGRLPPRLVELEYLDDEGLLNDENGESPYYRKIVEFTPMLILVDGSIEASVELAAIRVKEIRDGHTILAIEGAGIKRRLGQGVWQKPIRSPAYRALSSAENDTERIFYAPMEEAAGATTFEIFKNIGSMSFTGTLTFGGYTASPSSERMVTFNSANAMIFAEIPSYSSSQHKICTLWTLPTPSLAANTLIMRVYCTGGNTDFIDVKYAASGDGSLILIAYGNGVVIDNANSVGWGDIIIGRHFFMSLELTQNGANLDTRVLIVNSDGAAQNDDPLTGVTIGRVQYVALGQTDCTGASVGHLIVGNLTTAFGNYISTVGTDGVPVLGTQGYNGEWADDRIQRLANEEGFSVLVHSSSQFGGGDTVRLGPQPLKPLLEIMELSAEADGGILDEDNTAFNFVYRTRRSLANQAPSVTLVYSDISPPLLPVRDDQGRQNDVTVANTNGTTQRYIIPDGDYLHYSTEAPPNGMNDIAAKTDLNLYDDTDTELQAAWRAHHGSWRASRVPNLNYNLSRAGLAGDTVLDSGFYFLRVGDTIKQGTIGASKWVAPDHMLLMVQGIRKTFGKFGKQYSLTATPGDSWENKVTDSDGSTLANPINSTDIDLYIDPGELGPAWTENDNFYAQINGDVFKVTFSLTLTPTYIGAGAIASANNGPVTPALPAGITVDEGQSLFIWATIRNSGTGTPDDEPGWDTIVSFGNTKLYHRYYETGVTAPQITFTGGVANADCLARMFAFSGVSKSLCSGTKLVPAAATQLNGSAQNVAYPALTLARDGTAMMFLWKQDDATGYAPPGSMTEIADNSSTAGDDASIAAYYQLTAAEFAAGSVTVTGGAAAISRAIVLAFRPMQQFFGVTRDVLNNAAAHSVGDAVHVWRQGVTGL